MSTNNISAYGSDAASAAAAAANNNSSTSGTSTDALGNQTAFLQLLVAQLQNQDPSQPMDGTTFVTQLAQFSDVEQNIASRQDLDQLVAQFIPSATSSSSTSSGSNQATTNS